MYVQMKRLTMIHVRSQQAPLGQMSQTEFFINSCVFAQKLEN